MNFNFDSPLPMTEIELGRLFDIAANEVSWERTQMLIAEGLEVGPSIHAAQHDFMASFPPVAFGSDIALKRQILAVLCLTYQDLKSNGVAATGFDMDKYVSLIIPKRHRRFIRLVEELEALLPWIGQVMRPRDESDAIAAMRRLNFLQIGATVRIRLAD